MTTAAVATPAGVPAPAAMPEPAPVGVQPPMVSAAPAMAPMAPTSPAAPATSVTSTPAPVASAITPPAAPPVLPAPTTGAEGFGYMVGSVGLGMGAKAQTRARSAVPAGHIATSVGGAAAAEHPQGRARKRPRSIVDPGYRYEFIEADDNADAIASALPDRSRPSGSGDSLQGFAGTIPKPDVRAAGLITLAGNESGGGARMPMLPESWDGL